MPLPLWGPACNNTGNLPASTQHLTRVGRSHVSIGLRFLNVNDPSTGEAEIGYCLRRCYRGQGLATEAVRAVLAYGFETAKLRRIWATCTAENVGSVRVMEKIGLLCEGRLRETRCMHGCYW